MLICLVKRKSWKSLKEYQRSILREFSKWQIKTFGAVKNLRDRFSEFILIAKEARGELYKIYEIDNIKVQCFSDSIIIYTPIVDDFDSRTIPVVDLATILLSLVTNYFYFLIEEIPFRVGVEIGVGNDNEKYGLYGSAISNAYSIENSIANYPRIVLGKILSEYLHELTEYKNPNCLELLIQK